MQLPNQNRKYGISVTLEEDATGVVPVGAPGVGSVTITNLPFCLRRITHGIIGDNHLDPITQLVSSVFQDGQYTVTWRTDQRNYQNEPLLCCAAYGSDNDHFLLETPEEIPAKTTIHIEVVNQIERSAETVVQFIFHGAERNVNVQDQGPS
jgi:hypothetical protein